MANNRNVKSDQIKHELLEKLNEYIKKVEAFQGKGEETPPRSPSFLHSFSKVPTTEEAQAKQKELLQRCKELQQMFRNLEPKASNTPKK